MRPKICLSIMEKTNEKILESIERYQGVFDVLELRLDEYNGGNLNGLLNKIRENKKNPEIILCDKNEEHDFAGLISSVEDDDVYIDVPFKNDKILSSAKKNRKKTICSYHDYEKTPSSEEIAKIILELAKEDADAIKVAFLANERDDIVRLLSVVKSYAECENAKRIIAVSMGENGKESRIISGEFGSWLTYASNGKPTAGGQFEAGELKILLDKYYRE